MALDTRREAVDVVVVFAVLGDMKICLRSANVFVSAGVITTAVVKPKALPAERDESDKPGLFNGLWVTKLAAGNAGMVRNDSGESREAARVRLLGDRAVPAMALSSLLDTRFSADFPKSSLLSSVS